MLTKTIVIMRKTTMKTAAMLLFVLCGITTLTACTEMFSEDETDPEAVEALTGLWRGHSNPTGEWRVELKEDMTARVTNFVYDFGEYDVWVVQDYYFDSWTATTTEFDIGGYYWGDIQSNGYLRMNVRLVNTEEEEIYVSLRKTTEDDFTPILDKQEMKQRLSGKWEGLSNDGKYVRRLELEWARGVTSGLEVRYYAEGNTWPEPVNWDIDGRTFIIENQTLATTEQCEITEQDVLALPSGMLTRVEETVDDEQTVASAIGKWVGSKNDTITLNADKTVNIVSNNYNGDDYEWQTVNGEVWLLFYGRDDIGSVTRYIISGDELILFPGFANSPRLSRVKSNK